MNIADLPAKKRFILRSEAEVNHQIHTSAEGAVWRGMGNSEWCPRASVDVFMKAQGLEDRQATLNRLKRSFVESLNILGILVPEEEYDFWALAQHLGVPTMLLDWSVSPWIALYFACIGSRGGRPGSKMVLFRLNAAGMPRGAASDFRIIEPGYTVRNKRLPAQLGLFSYSTDECFLESLMRLDLIDHLEAFIIPTTLAGGLMKSLVAMNIRTRVLFPDEAGAVQDAKDAATWLR